MASFRILTPYTAPYASFYRLLHISLLGVWKGGIEEPVSKCHFFKIFNVESLLYCAVQWSAVRCMLQAPSRADGKAQVMMHQTKHSPPIFSFNQVLPGVRRSRRNARSSAPEWRNFFYLCLSFAWSVLKWEKVCISTVASPTRRTNSVLTAPSSQNRSCSWRTKSNPVFLAQIYT